MKATELLKKQHREVKKLFGQAKKAKPGERRRVVDEITEKLRSHMMIEEEIFCPAVRELRTKTTEQMVPEAYEEHHVVKLVIGELPQVDISDGTARRRCQRGRVSPALVRLGHGKCLTVDCTAQGRTLDSA